MAAMIRITATTTSSSMSENPFVPRLGTADLSDLFRTRMIKTGRKVSLPPQLVPTRLGSKFYKLSGVLLEIAAQWDRLRHITLDPERIYRLVNSKSSARYSPICGLVLTEVKTYFSIT